MARNKIKKPMKTTVTMRDQMFIDPQGGRYFISRSQQDIIKDDWVACLPKEDGEYAMSYNVDGTPAPDPAPLPEQVKSEAGRRILDLCPEWKQRNHIATDLTYTKITQAGGSLTAEQEETRAAIESVWVAVQTLRLKSDEIEAMSPIPQDFRNDSYWI
jgi:hypothetical protein